MNDQSALAAWQLDEDSAAAYETYLVGRFFRRWADRLVEHANVTAGESVLDAGCGTGIVARTTASRLGGKGKVVGVDLNEGMLGEARRQDAEGAVSWEPGSLEALPFDDNLFDVALSQQVLQFVPERARALEQLYRVLKPGGRLVFALLRDISFNPSYEALAGSLDRHAGKDAGDMMRSPFRGPDSSALREALEATGFRDITVQHDILDVRYPGPAEFLREEAASSPLAGPLAALDENDLRDLLKDLDTTLAPYTDDHGVTFPMETRFVTAFR
jgi:ubiquinone/menaquinone biosynthesis C-methylase UbiE